MSSANTAAVVAAEAARQAAIRNVVITRIINRKDGHGIMNDCNETLQKFIGKDCKIEMIIDKGFGSDVTGTVKTIQDNWLEVETKKGLRGVNLDFVMAIRLLEE